MALKALLDSLDGLPDAVKSEYTDNGDGTFKLSVEGAESLVDTSGLKKTVKKLREENASLSAWAKAFPDKTPEEIADLVKAGETGDKPDIGKLRKEIAEAEAKKHTGVYTERDTLAKQLRSLKMTDALTKLALKAGVFEDRVDDAVDAALKTCDLDEKGNIIVLDDEGETSSQTPEQYFTDTLKTKKAWLFKAPESSGSDTGNSRRARDASSATTVKSKKDFKTDAQKVAFIKQHGRKAFQDLPAE